MSARAPNITPTKYALSVVFVIAGVAIFTYAMTRTVVTENVLNIAARHVEDDLVAHQRRPDPANPTVLIDPEVALDARQFIGRVHESGGMYYWHNDAILYWGAGAFLLLVGLLIPFYHGGGLIQEFRNYVGRKYGLCRHCGYDLRGSPDRCPECGTSATHDNEPS